MPNEVDASTMLNSDTTHLANTDASAMPSIEAPPMTSVDTASMPEACHDVHNSQPKPTDPPCRRTSRSSKAPTWMKDYALPGKKNSSTRHPLANFLIL